MYLMQQVSRNQIFLICSDDFLMEIKDMEHKNLALETLKKLLNDEINQEQKQI